MQTVVFDNTNMEIALRLVVAFVIGGLVGLERSYHGRPAGFRTHALVGLASSLLMLLAVEGEHWFPGAQGRISFDPTRMAQGIMTGIGFLGAGTIMKDGLAVRGLTTAASIWITAAIGILVGIGFYFSALFAAALTLGTLSVFRWVESRLPAQFYAHFAVRFSPDEALSEPEIRRLLQAQGFTVANLAYRLNFEADFSEYRMIIRSDREGNVQGLIDSLGTIHAVKEFRIAPSGR